MKRQFNDILKIKYIQIQVPTSCILVGLLAPSSSCPNGAIVWAIDQNCNLIQNFITKSRPPFIIKKQKSCRSITSAMENTQTQSKQKTQLSQGETNTTQINWEFIETQINWEIYWRKQYMKAGKTKRNWGFPPMKIDGSPSKLFNGG